MRLKQKDLPPGNVGGEPPHKGGEKERKQMKTNSHIAVFRHLALQLPDLGSHDELLPLDDGLNRRHHGIFDGLVLGDEIEQRNVQKAHLRGSGQNPEIRRT